MIFIFCEDLINGVEDKGMGAMVEEEGKVRLELAMSPGSQREITLVCQGRCLMSIFDVSYLA